MVQATLKKHLPTGVVNRLRRFKNLFRYFKPNNFLKESLRFAQVEKEVLILPQILKHDSVCLDVGANLGMFSYHLAKFFPQGRIYCFEPRHDLFAKLNKNLNSEKNCTFVNQAVSNISEELEITLDPSHGNSTVVDKLKGEGLRTQKILATSIDDFCDSKKLDRVDFVKIDVEGHEFKVIEGAQKMIAAHRPIILCEAVNSHLLPQGLSVQKLIGDLKHTNNYDAYFLQNGFLKPADFTVIKDKKIKGQPYIYNWIFVPHEKANLLNNVKVS